MILMTFHCLLLFDCMLDGYSHNDLGARNVLYVYDEHPAGYFRYTFPSNTGYISIDIKNDMLIPKIWDFAFVRYGTAAQYMNMYDYLNNAAPPDLDNITEERFNDVYILLQDIANLISINNIRNSLFSSLDLSEIKYLPNNTASVYKFLELMPIPDYLMANDNNRVIHKFPPDNSVFNNFNMDRQIIKH